MDYSWSELPLELLDLIWQRLQLPECLTFNKVCQSWRSVFRSRRYRYMPPPFMMLRPDPDINSLLKRPELLYSIQGHQFLKIKSCGTLVLHSYEDIIGTSKGWLLILCNGRLCETFRPYKDVYYPPHMYLFNPISRRKIHLPWLQNNTIYYFTLSSDPTFGHCILVLCGLRTDGSLFSAWCIPDDNKWKILKIYKGESTLIRSMVFHKGQLYVLHDNGDYVTYTFNYRAKVTGNGFIEAMRDTRDSYSHELVESGGELLFVMQADFFMQEKWEDMFRIYKQAEEPGRWVKVKNLNDHVLLISHRQYVQSFCTHNSMGSGFEGNSVYFIKNNELVKFSLTDGSSVTISLPKNDINFCYIGWILPQIW